MNRRNSAHRAGLHRRPRRAVAGGGRADQLGKLGGALKRAQQFKDVEMSEAEEAQLGAEVSTAHPRPLRRGPGPGRAPLCALVGMALAQASSKPGPNWKFIVLDTDAVNAFAAPGGFVHITKGALANLKNESELAGVLGHEIIHVTEKHTIRAIQKGKLVQMGADETVAGNSALMSKLADKAYEVIEGGFGRGEELESDEKGIVLANTVGYAPQGMNGFLNMLIERNKSAAAGQERPVRLAPRDQGAHRQDDPADRVGQAHLDGHGRRALHHDDHLHAGRGRRDRHHRSGVGGRRRGHRQAGRGAEEEGPGRPGRAAARRAAASTSRHRSPARARPAAPAAKTAWPRAGRIRRWWPSP